MTQREWRCQTGHAHWSLEGVVKCDNRRIARKRQSVGAKRQREVDAAVREGLKRMNWLCTSKDRESLLAGFPIGVWPVTYETIIEVWREHHA